MCGFICLVKRENKKNKFISKDLLEHRGPDFTNEINFESVSIRHWRLSIVDLSEDSNQPIVKNNYIFVYNGKFIIIKIFQKNILIKHLRVILNFSSNY